MIAAVIKISAGFLLDLVLGDPHDSPHPVRLIGKQITFLENILRRKVFERAAGILLTVSVVLTVYAAVSYLSALSWALELFIIYTIFAVRSLSAEALKVYHSLMAGDCEGARVHISYLVSRDTAGMERSEIIRAAIETVTENIVDGVTAPLFYLFAGGAPLAMAYKAANTLDSMVGYKNEKYLMFGWASARFDDLLNFIPARITGFILIPVAALITGGSVRGAYRILVRDRHNHSSPNSAHSESAAAGALGLQLGGPTRYFGVVHDKPYIGDSVRDLEPEDIKKAITLLYATSCTGLVLGSIVMLGVHFLLR
jgi:adenosylcobinamide-phosphate synthase